MASENSAQKMKNAPLIIIALATILPFAFSTGYFFSVKENSFEQLKSQGKNAGSFLPAGTHLQSEFDQQSHQWQLVKLVSNDVPCDNSCAQQVSQLHHIVTALGKRSDKAHILVRQFDEVETSTPDVLESYSAFLAAPNGQFILGYKANQIGKPLFKDLKYLAKNFSPPVRRH